MKNIRTDHKTFKDDDQAVKAEDQTEPPLIVTAESYREDWADQRDHAAEGWDDLKDAAENRPERSERNTDQLEANQPEHSYDECIERRGAPPIEQCSAGCLQMGGRVAVSDVHTNLTVLRRI